MTCPKCRSKLKHLSSVKDGDVSYRVRVCINCTTKVYTKAVEEICQPNEVLKKISKRQCGYYIKRCVERLQTEKEGAE